MEYYEVLLFSAAPEFMIIFQAKCLILKTATTDFFWHRLSLRKKNRHKRIRIEPSRRVIETKIECEFEFVSI